MTGFGWRLRGRLWRSLVAAAVWIAGAWAGPEGYDPLVPAVSSDVVEGRDFAVKDGARAREIPVRMYLPARRESAPVVLFSHGLGGSRKGSRYLAAHWSGRGYVAVFLQHPGSDEGVWRDEPRAARMAALQTAASGNNFRLRVRDVSAVLDWLEAVSVEAGHPLYGRLDLKRVGMSGHSFGAKTTQAVSGQTFGRRALLTDPRIRAAIMFSPSAPNRGDSARAFGHVTIPWMLMTGTRDTAPIGNATVASRLDVFPHLPPGHKYELVLHEAEHHAFTDHAVPGGGSARNPNHHRVILALSTAFWDAYLREDAAARAWLQGEGVQALLETKDRWQYK